MRRRRTFKYIVLLVGLLVLGALFFACAADTGDAPKLPGTSGGGLTNSATEQVTQSGTGMTTGSATGTTATQSSTGTGTTGPSTGFSTVTGTGSTTGTMTSVDTSPDASVDDDADAAPTVGAGCAAGATVIVLTFSSGTVGNTGNFNTTGPVCVELMGSVNQAWNVSNPGTRMVSVTSASGTAGPVAASSIGTLPTAPQAGADGFVYWNFTADNSTPPIDYTSLYVY